MEYRYMGFDQERNLRVYKFDGLEKGEPPAHFLVTADLSNFLANRVSIQEGPGLCALKLSSELTVSDGNSLELTNDDLRAHAYERAQAEERRIASRGSGLRRRAAMSK